jgi:hypothetical protein
MLGSRRRCVLALSGTALALAAVGLAVAQLPRIAEAWLLGALRVRGVVAAQLRVVEIGPSGAAVEDVALGAPAALTARRIALSWSPRGLAAGRIESMRVEGLRAHGSWREVGPPSFGVLDALLAGEDGGGALPHAIALRDARLELELPNGTLSATGSIDAVSDGEQLRGLHGALVLFGPGARGALTWSWEGGRAARLDGSLTAPGMLELPVGTCEDAALMLEMESSASPLELASLANARAWREAFAGMARVRLSARVLRRPGDAEALRDVLLDASAAAEAGGPGALEASLALGRGDVAVRLSAASELARDAGPAQRIDARLALASASHALPSAVLDGRFALAWDEHGLRFASESPARLVVAATPSDQSIALGARFESQVAPLSLGFAFQSRSLEMRAELAPAPLVLGGAIAARGRTPRLALTLDAETGRTSLRWSARGGALELPAQALRVSRLAASGGLELADDLAWLPIELARAHVESTGGELLFAPLDVEAEIAGIASALAARGTLRESAAADAIPFALQERRTADARLDALDVSLGPARLVPRGRDGVALVPALAAVLDSLGGTLAWRGRVERSDGDALRWSGVLALSDARVAIESVEIDGLQGELAIESVSPLRIAPSPLAFARANLGPELGRGSVRLALADGELSLRELDATTLGGRLRADGRIPISRGGGEAKLRFDGVSLEGLARFLEIEALSAEGALSGDLLAALGPRGWEIRDGALRADGPGAVRYRPEVAPAALAGDGASVLLDALTDFRFDALRAELAPAPDSEVEMRIALDGRNPALQSGRAIELRARVQAPLPELLALGGAWERIVRTLSGAL